MPIYSNSRFARIMDPVGRPTGAALVSYLKDWDVPVPPAARRRWRRRARRQREYDLQSDNSEQSGEFPAHDSLVRKQLPFPS